MKARVRVRGEQSGVSLILVLVTLTIFGLLVPVLGQFGSVNGVSAYIVKGQRFDRYAADSAMQGAIAWAQQTPTAGRANVDCPHVGTGALNAGSAGYERTASVRCQGFKGSGVPQETPTMPKYAVLALAADETGIRVNGAGTMATGGAWWSNSAPSAVTVGGGADLDATQDFVGGVGTCAGVVAAPTMCAPDHPGTAEPEPSGGAWAPGVDSITDVPVRDPFPAGTEPCDAVDGGVLELRPGFYWDIDGLNDIGNGCPGGPVTVRFEPGAFYFDFDFFDRENTTPNSTAWVVDGDVTLVSGEGTNDLGNCQPGVELTFGSTSHLLIGGDASADLCPLGNPGQKLSVVGVTNGVPTPDPRDAPSTHAIDAVPVPAFGFGWPPVLPDPNTLRDADCIDAPGDCSPTSTVDGTLDGRRTKGIVRMRVPDPMPDGIRPERFRISITHAEQQTQPNDLAGLSIRLDGLPDGVGCSLTNPQVVPPSFGAWTTSTFDCDVDSSRAYVSDGDLEVVYEGDNGGRLDAHSDLALDQVEVTATYTPPVVRNGTGCVTNTSGPVCDLLEIDQRSGAGTVFIAGTVLAPHARVHLRGGGAERTGLTRGVVVRSIMFSNLPDDPGFAPVSLPEGGSYTDRLVTFEASLQGSDDADEGETVLSARVRFCDAKPEGGSHEVGCAGPDATPPRVVSWEPRR